MTDDFRFSKLSACPEVDEKKIFHIPQRPRWERGSTLTPALPQKRARVIDLGKADVDRKMRQERCVSRIFGTVIPAGEPESRF
jgi:hypothetical protein